MTQELKIGKPLSHTSGRNDGKMLLQQPLLLLTIIVVFVLLFIFVLLPIFNVLKLGVTTKQGQFSFNSLIEIIGNNRYRQTFYNSIKLGLIVAVVATLIGYLFAFAITRTEMPFKRFFRTIATFPIISPPFILYS